MSSKSSLCFQEKKLAEMCHEPSNLNSRLTVSKKQSKIMLFKAEQFGLLGSNC